MRGRNRLSIIKPGFTSLITHTHTQCTVKFLCIGSILSRGAVGGGWGTHQDLHPGIWSRAATRRGLQGIDECVGTRSTRRKPTHTQGQHANSPLTSTAGDGTQDPIAVRQQAVLSSKTLRLINHAVSLQEKYFQRWLWIGHSNIKISHQRHPKISTQVRSLIQNFSVYLKHCKRE